MLVETIILSSSGTKPNNLMASISIISSLFIMSPRLTMSCLILFITNLISFISLASNSPIILSASLTADTSGFVTTIALSAPAIAFLKPCSIPAGQSIII